MGVLETWKLGLGKKGDETFVLCASYVFQKAIVKYRLVYLGCSLQITKKYKEMWKKRFLDKSLGSNIIALISNCID